MARKTEKPANRIYVVDDDDAFRLWFGMQLESFGFQITGFASGGEFLDVATDLEPACVVSDVRMPEFDGFELLERLHRLGVSMPVVLITGEGDVPLAVRAMRAGAVDFIIKPFSDEAILDSIRRAQGTLDATREQQNIAEIATQRLASLTPREHEVLAGVVGGMSSKDIARRLGISRRTVEFYRAQILSKTRAGNLSELVRFGLLAGVTPVEPAADQSADSSDPAF